MAGGRLFRNQCDEMFTEYPFFRDGMTIEEFEQEQKKYFAFLASGGSPFLYNRLLKENSVNSIGEVGWATGTLKEVPFWRDDMQPEEYDMEREYFHKHWDDWVNGKYIPLWKRKRE